MSDAAVDSPVQTQQLRQPASASTAQETEMKGQDPEDDVISIGIVGGGISGLVLAESLRHLEKVSSDKKRRRRIKLTIFERLTKRYDISRELTNGAFVLHLNGEAVLRHLGMLVCI